MEFSDILYSLLTLVYVFLSILRCSGKFSPMKKFIIDHIDPLGQGVFKDEDQIYFIPKTLPDESGVARVLKKKKNLNFCEVTNLTEKSIHRIEALCPHFNDCPNCQYLHTNYEQEIEFKLTAFERKVRLLGLEDAPKIDIIKAPSRLGYRNRVQLHYCLKQKKIGAINAKTNRIVSIPQCQIMEPEVKEAFDKLLLNDSWLQIAQTLKRLKGHVEIYNSRSGLKVTWNQKYSQGGFTQVYEQMNQLLNEKVLTVHSDHKHVLDLFGGDGNLSQNLNFDKRVIIDLFEHRGTRGEKFSLNLFNDEALATFLETHTNTQFSSFIIDPPRSGFKNIGSWTNHFKPEQIIYVSCHPDTMIRDIVPLKSHYDIQYIAMFDLFPSTYHFEGLIKLVKRS